MQMGALNAGSASFAAAFPHADHVILILEAV
jgi:hypothetical protein